MPPEAKSAITPFGGNFVQTALNRTALDIQSGAADIVVLTGAECGYTQARARRQNVKLQWSEAPGKPDLEIGHDVPMSHDAEQKRGIRRPVVMYPIFENALRYARGESIAAHLERVSRLWAGFSAVASRNPHAWIREAKSAEEIRTPGPDNRHGELPVSEAHEQQQQRRPGRGADPVQRRDGAARWAFRRPASSTPGRVPTPTTPTTSPSATTCAPRRRSASRAERVLELAGLTVGELAHVDLYSCFPVAVQVAAREIGLSEGRPLTVTGGLTFGGGPLNNYVMHGVARMAEVLRGDPGTKGLCTANGGFLTKHALVVYSTEPPPRPFRHEDVQPLVDATPKRAALVDYEGPATIESYTVEFEGESPALGHAAILTPDGRRSWANSPSAEVAAAMTREEFCGRPVRVRDGVFEA